MSTNYPFTLGKDALGRCPNCNFAAIPIPASAEVLLPYTCPSCEAELILVSLDPLELEEPVVGPDEDEDLVLELLDPDEEYEDYEEDEEDW